MSSALIRSLKRTVGLLNRLKCHSPEDELKRIMQEFSITQLTPEHRKMLLQMLQRRNT